MNVPETPKEISARIADFGPDHDPPEKNEFGYNRKARRAKAKKDRQLKRAARKLQDNLIKWKVGGQ